MRGVAPLCLEHKLPILIYSIESILMNFRNLVTVIIQRFKYSEYNEFDFFIFISLENELFANSK